MKFRWDKKYLYWGVTAFCVIVASALVIWVFGKFRSILGAVNFILGVLAPIVAGLIIAYLLNPLLRFFENKCFRPLLSKCCKGKEKKLHVLSRSLSIAVTLGLAVLCIAGLCVMTLPEIYSGLERLVLHLPNYLDTAVKWVQGLFKNHSELEQTVLDLLQNAANYLTDWLQKSVLPQADALIASISSGVISVAKGIVNFLIGLIVSVYVMYNKEKFFSQGKKLLCAVCKPKTVRGIMRNVRSLHRCFGEYFSGMLLSALIVGALCAIFMVCFNMPYAALVSVLVGITNMIPFLGPYIGAALGAFLILLESPLKCLIFLIFIAVLQFFEGNIVAAKILGLKTGLSGFWIVFSILLGGGLFGFAGMVCAVPVFSYLYFLIGNICERRLAKRNLPTETAAYDQLHMLDPQSGVPETPSPGTASSTAAPGAEDAVSSSKGSQKHPPKK